jgi:hypothetical protein
MWAVRRAMATEAVDIPLADAGLSANSAEIPIVANNDVLVASPEKVESSAADFAFQVCEACKFFHTRDLPANDPAIAGGLSCEDLTDPTVASWDNGASSHLSVSNNFGFEIERR